MMNYVVNTLAVCLLALPWLAASCPHDNETEVVVSASVDQIEARLVVVETRQAALDAKNQELARLLAETVSFHAEVGSYDVVVHEATTLVLANVLRNQGNGYDHTTGIFTAPYSGTYCFLANALNAGSMQYDSKNYDSKLSLEIVVNNRGVAETWTNSGTDEEPASVHAVVSLKAGDTAKLVSHSGGPYGVGSYFGHVTSFSGFLVHHTPN